MITRIMALWQKDPSNVPLTIEVIDQLFREQNWLAAEQFFTELDPQNRQSPEICAKHIELLINQNQLDLAALEAAELATHTNQHPVALHYVALTAYLKGELPAVLALVNYATTEPNKPLVARQPLTPETVILVARALYHQGALSQAIGLLMAEPACLRLAEGLGLLAMLNLDIDDPQKVPALVEQALGLHPHQFDALLAYASYLVNQQQMAAALPVIEQVLSQQPRSGRALSVYGQIQFFDLQFPTAIETFKQAVHYMPDHIGTWHLLAWCYFSTQQWDLAEHAFSSALNLDRNFGESHGGLAVIAAMQGETDKATTLSKLALRLNPQSYSGLFARSILAQLAGDERQAQSIIAGLLGQKSSISGQTYQQMVDAVLRRRQGGPNPRSNPPTDGH